MGKREAVRKCVSDLRALTRPAASVQQIAEKVGVTRTTVYHWLEGLVDPSDDMQTKLKKHYGIVWVKKAKAT